MNNVLGVKNRDKPLELNLQTQYQSVCWATIIGGTFSFAIQIQCILK